MSADIRGLTVRDGFTDTSIIHRDCYLCLSGRELSPAKAGPISQRLRGPISTTLYTHFNFLLGWRFRVFVRVLFYSELLHPEHLNVMPWPPSPCLPGDGVPKENRITREQC